MRAVAAAVLALALAGSAAAATIQGTRRSETHVGTSHADLILARGGADRIAAGRGDDRIAVQYDDARDTVSCGPGRDVVNADLVDRVAADCEVVSRRLSRDIHRNTASQHQTEVEPDSFTFGRTTVAVFQSGRRFDGAAANIAFATSRDDGRTWRAGELPGITPSGPRPGPSAYASDPVVAYDAVHGAWLAVSLGIGAVTRLAVNRSPDGLVWSDPVDATAATAKGVAYDKEWLTCDNGAASLFRGRCYLAYSDLVRGGLSLQTSTDGGLTWSPAVTMPLAVVGAFPVVRPDGTLVIVYRTGKPDDENTRTGDIEAVRSQDGGVTLEPPALVSRFASDAIGLRFPVLPAADVDANGRIWVTWHDCALRPACDGNDVVASSSDDGIAWSAPLRLTKGTGAAIPTIAVDPATGRLAVLFYTVRAGEIDAAAVTSTDGGGTWTSPQRLSAQPMLYRWLPTTSLGRMLADYISLTFAGGRPLAVWALASETPRPFAYRQAIYATKL